MRKRTGILFFVLLNLGMAGIASSCSKGPAEKVGEKIDKAVQDTKDDLTKKR